LWEGLFGNWLSIYIIKKQIVWHVPRTHQHVNCPIPFGWHMKRHMWSYDGFQTSVQFVSASLPSRYNVCSKLIFGLTHTTLFFSFSPLISMLAMEKLKAVFHFLIFSYQVPNLLITICFICDDLWNWIFFQFHLPSIFYILNLIFILLIDTYFIWDDF